MTNSNSLRCVHCNLLNFANEMFCKRCKNPLPDVEPQHEQNTVNININLQNPNQNINLNLPNYQNQTQKPIHQNPQMNQPYQTQPLNQPQQNPQLNQTRRPPSRIAGYQNQNQEQDQSQNSEYQSQNQQGFQQWQQMQQQQQQQQQMQPQQQFVTNRVVLPGVFRQGNEFVVHKFAQIPERCVKCNEQVSNYNGGSYATQKYRWHNPLVYIALISPLIYVILSLVLSESVTLNIPMCNEHLENRKTVGNYLVGGGIASLIGIMALAFGGFGGSAFLLFIFAVIGLVIGNDYFYKPLKVSKIDSDYVYLKGASNEFLNQIPHP